MAEANHAEPKESAEELVCAFDLLRRLPQEQCEEDLEKLAKLVPHHRDYILCQVDTPFKVALDKTNGKEYLLCNYNRDGDSYRSHWSNTYDPLLGDEDDPDEGALPSEKLRNLEIQANVAFEQYLNAYFAGGISSAYFWGTDHDFAGSILFKRVFEEPGKKIKGNWDSIHVIEIKEHPSGRSADYKVTSTVILGVKIQSESLGTMNVGGSMTRQFRRNYPINGHEGRPHIVNIGLMVEKVENKVRETLVDFYVGKTKDIVNQLHSVRPLTLAKQPLCQINLHNELALVIKQCNYNTNSSDTASCAGQIDNTAGSPTRLFADA